MLLSKLDEISTKYEGIFDKATVIFGFFTLFVPFLYDLKTLQINVLHNLVFMVSIISWAFGNFHRITRSASYKMCAGIGICLEFLVAFLLIVVYFLGSYTFLSHVLFILDTVTVFTMMVSITGRHKSRE